MILEEDIEAIKERAAIYDAVEGFVKLKKDGANYIGLCPFHDEKTPSFTVSPAKNIYKCFGCGKSGDAISFLVEAQKKTYLEAMEWLSNKYKLQFRQKEKVEYIKPEPRNDPPNQKVIDWFKSRGISKQTVNDFLITEAIEWMPKVKKEVSVICFNYFREKELINIKFRDAQKNFKLSKDGERIFYNIDCCFDYNDIVIVEGEVDCLSFYEAGVKNVVSVPNGASGGKQNLDYLDNCYQYFIGKKRITIAVDNDGPGELLKEELARRLGKDRCFLVYWPEKCKDANDVLKLHGKNYLVQLYENAIPYPLEGELTMNDMAETLYDYYENGYPKGVDAGIKGFDELLTFLPGQLTMVTGIPGSGKDEFVNYIMTGLAERHDWKFGVIGFEEQAPTTATKLIEKLYRKSFDFRKDISHRLNREQLERGMLFVHEHFKFINTDEIEVTIDGLIAKITELVERYGINGVLISPWNCIEHKIPFGYSETQYISEVLQKLLVCLRKRNIHCFLIAHPTKIMKDKKTDKYEVPTLYNISGSAHFFNKTHNGICVYRDFANNITDIYVQKVKWSWLGKLGFCSFNYDTFTRQYIPI